MAKTSGGTKKAYVAPSMNVEALGRYTQKGLKKERSIKRLDDARDIANYALQSGNLPDGWTRMYAQTVSNNITKRYNELREQYDRRNAKRRKSNK